MNKEEMTKVIDKFIIWMNKRKLIIEDNKDKICKINNNHIFIIINKIKMDLYSFIIISNSNKNTKIKINILPISRYPHQHHNNKHSNKYNNRT